MIKKHKRYIYDALYGAIDLVFDPVIWKAISTPELQRLREVRLCNINSLCLTGGANVNRFEHSIGTCYLAQECLKAWPLFNPLSKTEEKLFLLAALLHDSANAAFGHSLEYIESSSGFNPERDFAHALQGTDSSGYKYRLATLEPIFFGMGRELVNNIITPEEYDVIGQMVCGKGKLGPLISGTIDLDNIDNVFRMAYHIGIVKSGSMALELARSIWVNDNGIIVKHEAKPLLEEWQRIRYELYKLLLLNPEEFSGKCMLSDAISLAKRKKSRNINICWHDIDYELLQKIYSLKSLRINIKENYLFEFNVNPECCTFIDNVIPESINEAFMEQEISLSKVAEILREDEEIILRDVQKEYCLEIEKTICKVYKRGPKDFDIASIISRLMKGNLYGCLGIFSTKNIEKYSLFTKFRKKIEIENEINELLRKKFNKDSRLKSVMISIHPIIDANKTERKITLAFDDGITRSLGNSSRQLLLGVFASNTSLNMYDVENLGAMLLTKIRKTIANYFKKILDDQDLEEVTLYAELDEISNK